MKNTIFEGRLRVSDRATRTPRWLRPRSDPGIDPARPHGSRIPTCSRVTTHSSRDTPVSGCARETGTHLDWLSFRPSSGGAQGCADKALDAGVCARERGSRRELTKVLRKGSDRVDRGVRPVRGVGSAGVRGCPGARLGEGASGQTRAEPVRSGRIGAKVAIPVKRHGRIKGSRHPAP